jgi:hypothetical protein
MDDESGGLPLTRGPESRRGGEVKGPAMVERLHIGYCLQRLPLAALLVVALGGVGQAQDSNYWTYQFGTKANLLGGAVVGSVLDVSAGYYNPGALALIKDPEVIATSKVVELSNLKIEPESGFQIALDNLRFDFAPGFVGGQVPFAFLGDDHVLGYSIFTRQLFKATMDAANVGTFGEVSDTLPNDDFFAMIRGKGDLNETWVGVSWSRVLGPKLAFGVTGFVAYRNQKLSGLVGLQTYSDTTQAIVLRERAFSYWNARVLLKAGLTYEWQGVSVGLTLTSGSLSVLGGGRTLFNVTQFGSRIDDPAFVASYQDGLGATFHSPFSLGFGAAYSPKNNTTMHFTAEWFSDVDRYDVMELEPFEAQSSGDTIAVDFVDLRDAVLNAGIGIEHTFTPTLSGFASFRTDFTSAPSDGTSSIVLTDWNLYHLTAGAAFKVGTADFPLGLGFGWGGKKKEQVGIDTTDDDPIAPLLGPVDVKFTTLRLIFAFAI